MYDFACGLTLIYFWVETSLFALWHSPVNVWRGQTDITEYIYIAHSLKNNVWTENDFINTFELHCIETSGKIMYIWRWICYRHGWFSINLLWSVIGFMTFAWNCMKRQEPHWRMYRNIHGNNVWSVKQFYTYRERPVLNAPWVFSESKDAMWTICDRHWETGWNCLR